MFRSQSLFCREESARSGSVTWGVVGLSSDHSDAIFVRLNLRHYGEFINNNLPQGRVTLFVFSNGFSVASPSLVILKFHNWFQQRLFTISLLFLSIGSKPFITWTNADSHAFMPFILHYYYMINVNFNSNVTSIISLESGRFYQTTSPFLAWRYNDVVIAPYVQWVVWNTVW